MLGYSARHERRKTSISRSKRIFLFQPTLVQALFDIEDIHRLLGKRKRFLISRKPSVNSKWFEREVRSLSQYSGVLTGLTDIGRSVGDAFAWFFYCKSQHMLQRHLRYPASKRMPAGVGGRGELEFLKQVHPPGHFLLYHGITSFLTIGDVSLIDLQTFEVVSLGELKSDQIGPGVLHIRLHTVSRKPESLPFAPKDELLGGVFVTARPAAPALPDNARLRLERQLEAMANVIKYDPVNGRSDVHDAYHFQELTGVAEAIGKKNHAYVRIDAGLLVVAVRPSTQSFSGRLMSQVSGQDVVRRLDGLVENVLSILDPEMAEENCLLIGSMKTLISADAVPLFWWPVAPDFLERIYFREIEIVTAYNPAHLVRQLRSVGFQVERTLGPAAPEYKIKRDTGTGGRVEITTVRHFINLIQNHLMKERKIVDMLLTLVNAAENGRLPENSEVEISIVHHVI